MSYFHQKKLPSTSREAPPLIEDSIFSQLVKELSHKKNVPLNLAIQSILGTASLAYSNLVSVRNLHGDIEPTNMYFIAEAPTGYGKTRSMEEAIKSLNTVQQDLNKFFITKIKEYEAEKIVWEDEKKSIRKSKEDAESKKIKLYLHELKKPEKPTDWKLIIEDTTPIGALERASKQSIMGIISSEGKNFLNPKNMHEMEKYCALWSNENISINRKNYSLDITNLKTTISIMIQPGAFRNFMDKKGNDFRDSGFAARTCFTYI